MTEPQTRTKYGYDSWANLLSAQPISGYTCTQSNLSLTVNTKNQITNTGLSYDASGNTLTDGLNTYVWDGESQIKTAAGVNYTYDGDGNRLQKSSGKIYWYGAGSEVLNESDASGNVTDEYVFFAGKRVAHRVISGGSIYYYAEDFIGSSRVITTSNGTVCYETDLQPFGKEVPPIVNTCPQNYKFTGKERDTETGNDDFGARYFSSSFGRWLSPDWSAIPAPVPYATLTNPQTLNLYQYVGNSPETFADMDGHFWPIGVRDPYVSNSENMSVDIYGYGSSFAGSQEYQDSLNEAQGQPQKQAQNQQTTTETPRRDDLIAVRSSTKVESAQPLYALTADVQYTIVDAKTLKTQANPEGVQLAEKLAPGADPSVAKDLIHGNNPVEKSRTLTDAVYITPGLMKQTYALKQQILVGGKAVQIFDRNSSGAMTGGRWVNVQSVIQGKFFYQGTEWKPGNTY